MKSMETDVRFVILYWGDLLFAREYKNGSLCLYNKLTFGLTVYLARTLQKRTLEYVLTKQLRRQQSQLRKCGTSNHNERFSIKYK